MAQLEMHLWKGSGPLCVALNADTAHKEQHQAQLMCTHIEQATKLVVVGERAAALVQQPGVRGSATCRSTAQASLAVSLVSRMGKADHCSPLLQVSASPAWSGSD